MKVALFNLSGGTCTGCRIAIENFSKHLQGVEDVFIDISSGQIQVTFQDQYEESIIEDIPDFVRKIGYSADLYAIDDI